MNKKKTYTILIIGILLTSISLIVVPASAGELHTVRGDVYIDNVKAPAGIEVKISFPTGDEPPIDEPPELTSDTGHYQIDFQGHEWEVGEFHVIYNGIDYIPVDNQLVEIKSGILGYEIDLHINTNSGGNGGNGGTGGNGNYGGPSPTAPTADANGPYYAILIDGIAKVDFDGSGSTGSITSYSWDFGDGKTGTGVSPTHEYTALGKYTVTLTVTGPGGFSTDNTFTVISGVPNIPPTAPVVTGQQKGHKNNNYEYTAVSTDDDNDTIQYIFNWDDGSITTSDFITNGTSVTVSHNWSSWGIYTISVKAYDNKTVSNTKEYVVLINVLYIKNIGYLIDEDSDGIYELFHSSETGSNTVTEKQEDGTYLIDSDITNGWDWIYDPVTDILTKHVSIEIGEKIGVAEEPADNITSYLLIMVIVLIILLVIFSVTTKKKEK